ncbi:MAG: hypothetical protein ACLRVN_02080 [Butyricicoccus sp.]
MEINEFGAELTRFTSKKDGTEYVWKGDPAAWKRHAPILFPIGTAQGQDLHRGRQAV